MKHDATCGLLACLALALAPIQAQADDDAGFYAANAERLREVPTHVVVLHPELRTQLPYGVSRYDPHLSSTMASSISSNLAGMPGVSFGQAVGAGIAGGLIAGAIVSAVEKNAAESMVEDAHANLQQAGCALPDGADLARTLAESAAQAPWAGGTVPPGVVLGEKQDVEDVVDARAPRHVLVATYSLTPDFSTVVTSLMVDTYADGFEGSDARRWASRPLRSDRLLVFSDQVALPDKSAAEIEAAVAREEARYAAGPIADLVAKARTGDVHARKKAVALMREHERLMRAAQAPDWTPAQAAAHRSALWTADGCQPLATALAANNEELGRLLGALYASTLPVAEPRPKKAPPVDIMSPLPTEEAGVRRTLALPDNFWLSRRGGDYAPLAHLYTWYTP